MSLDWLQLLDTDSYKLSHFKQYPPNTTWMMSYLESRGGDFDGTVFFGLQYILKRYMARLTGADWGALQYFCASHGLPLNAEGFRYIYDELGYLPLKIRAVPEGSVVGKKNVLMTVESTDPKCFWLVSWVETLLARLWYPINVATLAYECRLVIQTYLNQTSDDPESIWYKLHDFGARGSSSAESAMIASMAHLTSFMGTDTLLGLIGAGEYYGCPMAGHSIPASEHSTITMWGKGREEDAYRNMLEQYGQKGAVFACVSDSYDIHKAVAQLWGDSLKAEVLASGSTVVIRPDSGEPGNVAVAVLDALARAFGTTLNSKNYKVLNPAVRVIWGDGMNYSSLVELMGRITRAGYATSNMAFGMGGALVQNHNRDTHRMAFKCCAAEVDGKLVEVYKDPSTDHSKRSKAGVVDLIRDGDEYRTVTFLSRSQHSQSALRTVFENGKILIDDSLDTIRTRLWGTP